MKIGANTVSGLYLSSTAASRAYLGASLVWEAGGGFDPVSLFAAGEQGAWYDPSDLSTVFTDTAGTTPATVGQSVARINDKSGRGNHATQATVAAQPILRQTAGGLYYLEYDGVDDDLRAAFPNVTYFKSSILGINIPSGAGSFVFFGPVGDNTRLILVGTSGSNVTSTSANAGSPTFRRDGGSWTPANRGQVYSDLATGVSRVIGIENVTLSGSTWSNLIILGYTSGFKFTGKFFGGIVLDRPFAGTERTDVEGFIASKSGVTI
jgi:hypothetical protein